MPRLKANRLPNMLAFNGSSDFMTLPITPAVTGFNLAFWAIRRLSTTNARILDWQDAGPEDGITVVEVAGGQIQFVTRNAAASTGSISSTKNVNGRLDHYAVTHNGTEMKLYENGVLIGTDSSSVMTAAAATFSVGRRAGGGNAWNGKLGELVFQNSTTPWTQAQITDLYYNGVIPSGASYWLFDGNVLDGSGNGNHGTLTGGTYDYRATPRLASRFMGGSTLFNGTTSKIDCGATDIIGTGDVTVSSWIKLQGWGELTGRIIDNGKFFFRVSDTAGQKAILVASDGANAVCGSANGALILGKWFHVIATRTSAGVVNVFINGVRSGSANQDSGTPAAATTNTIIGNDTAAGKTFQGNIAEVKIFNSILTASQIQALYTSGNAGVTPVASYDLDEQPSTYVDSISANNGTGTATTYSPDTPVQQRVVVSDDSASLLLDGTGDYITTAITPGTGPLSFSVQVKRIGTGTNNDRVVDCFDGSPTNGFALLQPNGSTGFRFDVYNNTALQASLSTGELVRGRWYTITCTFETNSAKLYVNGLLVATDTSCALTQTTNPILLGTRVGAAASFLTGGIKSFQYYARVLTASEVASLHFNRSVPSGATIDYRLNEGAGTTATDSSGNGNNGTITGATWSTNTPSKVRVAATARTSV